MLQNSVIESSSSPPNSVLDESSQSEKEPEGPPTIASLTTRLVEATDRCDLSAVKALVKQVGELSDAHDFNINAKVTQAGGTLLLNACSSAVSGDWDDTGLPTVSYLLDLGASPTILNEQQSGPLHYLIRRNPCNPQDYCTLLDRVRSLGADLNQQNDFGETPLHQAIRRINIDGVQWLLRTGADLHLRNKIGSFFCSFDFAPREI